MGHYSIQMLNTRTWALEIYFVWCLEDRLECGMWKSKGKVTFEIKAVHKPTYVGKV